VTVEAASRSSHIGTVLGGFFFFGNSDAARIEADKAAFFKDSFCHPE